MPPVRLRYIENLCPPIVTNLRFSLGFFIPDTGGTSHLFEFSTKWNSFYTT